MAQAAAAAAARQAAARADRQAASAGGSWRRIARVAQAAAGGGSAGGSGGGSGIGIGGGSVDHLYFAVVGDSRPANIDSTSSYPTAIIGKIYLDIQALSPQPQFVISTGDYMYANTNTGTAAAADESIYDMRATSYSGPLFPAMGNHECDGYTADNCTLNQTQNNQAFMSSLMAPLNQAQPYYRIDFSGTDGSWTAKLLVVACNAWSTTQQTWLTRRSSLHRRPIQFSRGTASPASANTGPCVSDGREALMKTRDL